MRESAKAAISVPKQPERKKLEKLRKKGLENEGKGSVVKRAAMSGKAEKDFNEGIDSPVKRPPNLQVKSVEVRALENPSSEVVTDKKLKKMGPDGVRRPSVPKPNKKQRMKRRLAKLEAGLIDNSRAGDPKQRTAQGKSNEDTEMGTKVGLCFTIC
ncbi:unnamed protein product [Heligmosomoides polygyrus]|uniref:Uncharacterized protein n=1 Tax=Heligmosomoides polygyrus TaxID=6339 RepID=A0A183F7C9_HELPZ|nr:unnamed protein product [Heligmosomoides polygyrus]